MYIKRHLSKKLQDAIKHYPVVSIIGPRQSGKTTLVKYVFKNLPYVSLEKPNSLNFALEDPEGFLNQHPKGMIIDEAQRAPELFSYIQVIVDEKKKNGLYILTGSQNFNLMEKITQSLAGRTAIHILMPFSQGELGQGKILPNTLQNALFTGGYPKLYNEKLNPSDWLANYVATYLERDVRSLKNVGDLSAFQRFLTMCAHRTGQILNLSSLANDCGVKHNTAKAWLSVLEASFIAFTLQPHFKNFNKRLVKSPKLYFYDTGLVCNLMSIQNSKDLLMHPNIGSLFETYVISELKKCRFNQGLRSNLYFWRDKLGREVDCLIEQANKLVPIEIKSGQTITSDYFKDLKYWCDLSKTPTSSAFVIYGGESKQKRKQATVLGWKSLSNIPICSSQ